jgi:glycerol-3-phosphate dehydrogenase (NAD(P)+)
MSRHDTDSSGLTKATVVGTGAMGCVVAHILAGNNVHVALLGRRADHVAELARTRENRRYLPGLRLPDRVTPTTDAVAALANTELIISSVPCQYMRGVWQSLAEHTPSNIPICSVAKGIEIDTLLRPSQILRECAGPRPIAVLSGPSIASEVAKCLPATVVLACGDSATGERVQQALTTKWFRVYTNTDVLGVELAGATKNVIALAAGILDGLRAGDNAKAALLTRGLVEVTRLGLALGARPETFVGLAGVGDLVTTCVSPYGRNRSAGERIGSGVSLAQVLAESTSVIEGIPTTRAVMKLAARHDIEMPITQAVGQVLFEDKLPLTAITELMNRPLKAEAMN